MEQYEVEAWLGPAVEEMSDREIAAFAASVEKIDEALPVPADGEPEDVADEREAAMSAALQVQLGETTLEEVSQNLVIARAKVARAMAAVKGAVIAAAAGGASETELAARTGLNRSTVRAALGK